VGGTVAVVPFGEEYAVCVSAGTTERIHTADDNIVVRSIRANSENI
jgi:hypothetical protein